MNAPENIIAECSCCKLTFITSRDSFNAQTTVCPACRGQKARTPMQIRLLNCGMQKIAVIKEIRAFTGLNLRDAKQLADHAPIDLPVPVTPVTTEQANYTVRAFREAGATITARLESTVIDKLTASSYIQTAATALGEGNIKDTRISLRAALRLLGDLVDDRMESGL